MERRHRRPALQRLLSTGAAAAGLGLALLLLASGATAAPACSGLVVKQGKTPTKTSPGRRLRLSYSVLNVQATRDVALGLIVPPGVIVQKTGSSTHQSKRVAPPNATLVDAQLQQAFGVYWPASTLLAHKRRKFSATFTVAKCATMPASLLFQARLIDVKNNAVVCTQDLAQQKVAVELPKRYKPHTNSTKAGKVCPLPFQLTDIGCRCNGTYPPTSFLGPRPTITQCYQFCYNYGGTPPPAYFEYTITDQGTSCACVGATCTRMPAEGSFVLQTLTGAPAPPVPVPEGTYPAVVDDNVLTMVNVPIRGPPGVWNWGYDANALATQTIMPITNAAAIAAATGVPEASIPANLYNGPFQSALLQLSTGGSARAYTGIYYLEPLPNTAFNGLLFKDFVLNGMEGSYAFYRLTAAGLSVAPSYKIYVGSPSTLQESIFVWSPGNNVATQGPVVVGEWMYQNFTENTGTSATWPTTIDSPASDEGWWCSQKCLLGLTTPYKTGAAVRRNLRSFVEGMLAQPVDSAGYKAINDAVITGFQLTIGGGESAVTVFTADFKVSTPRPNPIYSWTWNFGA